MRKIYSIYGPFGLPDPKKTGDHVPHPKGKGGPKIKVGIYWIPLSPLKTFKRPW